MNAAKTVPSPEAPRARALQLGWMLTLGLVLALVGYKAMGATARLQTGKLPTPLAGAPWHATALYLKTIWPALTFGVLIAAALRTLVPPSALRRLFAGGPWRGQLTAAAAATPLMLCSCCAAPLYVGVYERTRRIGPALALLIGAPSLNLAALTFTFLLFGPRMGVARIAMALVAVVAGTLVVARVAGRDPALRAPADAAAADDPRVTPGAFVASVGHVLVRTVPFVVVGVLASAALTAYGSPFTLGAGHGAFLAIAVAAAIAVPLALPTFFELPLALSLVAVGLPIGVAAALLFAGPAVNLPSLLTVARASSWRVSAGVAVAVWLVAVAGGVAMQLFAA